MSLIPVAYYIVFMIYHGCSTNDAPFTLLLKSASAIALA